MATTTPIQSLLAALEIFRVVAGKDVPIQRLIVFLYVAAHDGCLQATLTKATGMSEASVSRCVDALGPTDRHGRPGARLISRKQDPDDYKRWRLFLTPKGQSIADLMLDRLTSSMEESNDD
jgi:DNA-binding MarR family transcriptional regulator